MQSNNRSDIPPDIEKGKSEGRYKECFQLVLGVAGDHYSFYTSCLLPKPKILTFNLVSF